MVRGQATRSRAVKAVSEQIDAVEPKWMQRMSAPGESDQRLDSTLKMQLNETIDAPNYETTIQVPNCSIFHS